MKKDVKITQKTLRLLIKLFENLLILKNSDNENADYFEATPEEIEEAIKELKKELK